MHLGNCKIGKLSLGKLSLENRVGHSFFLEHDHLLSIHLLSVSLALGLSCTQASLALATLALQSHSCYQVNLLLGLTCYQNVCSPVSTAINAHLLFKTSYYPNTLLSKLVVFLNKLLSKPVLSCYHKLVAFK